MCRRIQCGAWCTGCHIVSALDYEIVSHHHQPMTGYATCDAIKMHSFLHPCMRYHRHSHMRFGTLSMHALRMTTAPSIALKIEYCCSRTCFVVSYLISLPHTHQIPFQPTTLKLNDAIALAIAHLPFTKNFASTGNGHINIDKLLTTFSLGHWNSTMWQRNGHRSTGEKQLHTPSCGT